MNIDILKCLGSGAKMIVMPLLNLLSGNAKGEYTVRTSTEKDDVPEHANRLCKQEKALSILVMRTNVQRSPHVSSLFLDFDIFQLYKLLR